MTESYTREQLRSELEGSSEYEDIVQTFENAAYGLPTGAVFEVIYHFYTYTHPSTMKGGGDKSILELVTGLLRYNLIGVFSSEYEYVYDEIGEDAQDDDDAWDKLMENKVTIEVGREVVIIDITPQ